MHYFYLFRCEDGSLYSGYAKDIEARQAEHNAGRGSKFVRSRGGGTVVYFEEFSTQAEALKREAMVKRWTRQKKLELIATKKPR